MMANRRPSGPSLFVGAGVKREVLLKDLCLAKEKHVPKKRVVAKLQWPFGLIQNHL